MDEAVREPIAVTSHGRTRVVIVDASLAHALRAALADAAAPGSAPPGSAAPGTIAAGSAMPMASAPGYAAPGYAAAAASRAYPWYDVLIPMWERIELLKARKAEIRAKPAEDWTDEEIAIYDTDQWFLDE